MVKQSTAHQARILVCSLCLLAAAQSSAFVIQQNPTTRFPSVPQAKNAPFRSVQLKPLRRSHAVKCPPLQISYASLLEKLPSSNVIDAVEAAKDGKVVASDVAASAGVSLSQARKDLTALATLSRGDIAVDRDGELIYSFPNNLKSVLASNSAKYKAMETAGKAWPLAFYVIRVSFGLALAASLVAIFTTIFFISNSSSSDDNRRRDNRGSFGGGGGMRMGGMGGGFWGPSPLDFFFYRPYGYYGTPGGSNRRDPEEMGFFESVFSLVFGDGNPNSDLEERRLSLVANMIRKNKGAVTAEQLAPYCDDAQAPLNMETSTYVDESFVLPIVAQLNGEPQVTEDGEIVYTFPDLQMSASSVKIMPSASKDGMTLRRAGLDADASTGDIKRFLSYNRINTRGALERRELVGLLENNLAPMTAREEAELMGSDPSVLQEQEYRFSLAPESNKVLVGGLGVVNLGGALYLGNLLGQYASYGVRLPAYFGLVQSLYPLLLGYAILFCLIPVARNFRLNAMNTDIRKRNSTRRAWQTTLASAVGNSRIGRKLRAASEMGTQMKRIGANSKDIVFDTSKPIEETERKRQDNALEEFDKLLDSDDNVFM